MNDANTLDGWVIAIMGGRALVGRDRYPSARVPAELSPVFELQAGFALTPNGLAKMPPLATPLLGLNIQTVSLPVGTVIIPFIELPKADQDALGRAVKMG